MRYGARVDGGAVCSERDVHLRSVRAVVAADGAACSGLLPRALQTPQGKDALHNHLVESITWLRHCVLLIVVDMVVVVVVVMVMRGPAVPGHELALACACLWHLACAYTHTHTRTHCKTYSHTHVGARVRIHANRSGM